jgi:hypothetical protein
MKKKAYRLQKDLTLLTFSLFILVVIWVSFSIYHKNTTSTINEVQQTHIKPITGKFDTVTIDKLRKRTAVEPDFSNPLGSESGQTNGRRQAPLEPTAETQTSNAVSPTPSTNEDIIPITLAPEQGGTP